MQFSFRDHHLLQMLQLHATSPLPLDVLAKNYFRSNKAIGSKDRKEIVEALYGMVRWKGLIDALIPDCTLPQKIQFWKTFDPETVPDHLRLSFPEPLFQLLSSSLGTEKALTFCKISNTSAPTTIRINPLKTTREALLQEWKGKFDTRPCIHSPLGIEFGKRENFWAMPEFKQGLFEVQDEGSQLLANLVKPHPAAHVLDYCAGAGGKTLAFAHHLESRGQIYLHDVRPHALQDAKKRLRRAGIQNAQILLPDASYRAKLLQKMDWVLVDAPCSGTGTFRRNPDMKWRFDVAALERLTRLQREIVAEAISFVRPKGFLVYGTCSVLPQENQEQIAYFCEKFNLQLVQPPLEIFPSIGGMDGFFGAILQRS